MSEKIIYIKESFLKTFFYFLGTGFIGAITIMFVVEAYDAMEINNIKDMLSLLPQGLLILALIGVISCIKSLEFLIKLVRIPHIVLSPDGISGNAIKKSFRWDEISEINVTEIPKWYFSLLKSLTWAAARPGRLSASYRMVNDLDEPELKKDLSKTYIKDKSGKKYTIKIECGFTIYEKIKNYMKDNNISL